MKIVAITDKKGSAIDRLARMNADRLTHLQYEVCTLHPKRPSEEEIGRLAAAIQEADLIDAQYWKSAIKARELFSEFITKIPTILTHHNEHNIHDTDKDHWVWKDQPWAAHVCKNGWQLQQLRELGVQATLIPHAADFSKFTYTEKLTDQKIVGYVGQIKKVKGVREIAQACKELGYKLMLIGSVSEAEYWEKLRLQFEETIITYLPGLLHVPDELIGRAYAKMRVYCANSDDGTESGTMPILEAMVAGVPVVARNIGLVRDCGRHQSNMYIRDRRYDDIEDLKAALKIVMENDDIANSLRENAWRTVRQYHPDRQAREYELLFRNVLYPREKRVSVIIPTAGRNAILQQNIDALKEQSYKNFEVVICEDNGAAETAANMSWIKNATPRFPFPIKHVWTRKGAESSRESYGLAKARNMGVIEATGEILVFCDDRMRMHPGAINAMVKCLLQGSAGKPEKKWIYGSKGVFKTFVENFSCTWRKSFIEGGMFNERMDRYGGMTQEVSARFAAQGFKFDFCPQALAEPVIKTHSRSKHRDDIIASKIKLYKMGLQ
jgi:glycosyltransferase involved in cell wall biosynthesis